MLLTPHTTTSVVVVLRQKVELKPLCHHTSTRTDLSPWKPQVGPLAMTTLPPHLEPPADVLEGHGLWSIVVCGV